jgi:predicted Fe-Mo cluster-binding NifX family protein
MRVVVTSNGAGLDAPASPVFGRCPSYVFVDTDSMEAETVENPAMNAAGGAGIQAAQFVAEKGAEAVITGNVGPNAYSVFQTAGVPVYVFEGGTVREAVASFEGDRLPRAGGATGPAHAGMGRGVGRRLSGASGQRRAGSASSGARSQAASTSSREEEMAELAEMAADLREKLAEVMDRLDGLEREE